MTTGFVFVLVLSLAELPLSQQTELTPLLRGVFPFRHGHPRFLNNPRARMHFMSKLRRQMSLSPLVTAPLAGIGRFSSADSFQPPLTATGTSAVSGISFIGLPIDSTNSGFNMPATSQNTASLPGFIDIINGSPSDLDMYDNINALQPVVGDIAPINELSNIEFGSSSGTMNPLVTNNGQGFHQRLSNDLHSILNIVPNVRSVTVGASNSGSRQNHGQGMINMASRDLTGVHSNVKTGSVKRGTNNQVPSVEQVNHEGSNINSATGGDILTPNTISPTNNDKVQLIHTPLTTGGNLIELLLPLNKGTNETGATVTKSGSHGNPNQVSLIPIQNVVNVTANNFDLKSFEQSASFPDTSITGIDITPFAIPTDIFDSVPVSQGIFQDTSVSTAHIKNKLPLNENVLSQGMQPLTKDMLQHATGPSNSTNLQAVTIEIGNIKNKPTTEVQVEIYNPFSTRLKPEAFGPGPYYECSPPARVVCGARIGWDDVIGMTDWCKTNCVVFSYSSYCDDNRCVCNCVETNTTT